MSRSPKPNPHPQPVTLTTKTTPFSFKKQPGQAIILKNHYLSSVDTMWVYAIVYTQAWEQWSSTIRTNDNKNFFTINYHFDHFEFVHD
jgi:hypothetical protein